MAKIKWLLIALLIIAMLALPVLAACGPVGEEEEEEEEEPVEVTVLIGGSFPLTGPYPEDGAAVLAAFQHYAEWVNDNHKMSPWSTDSFPENVILEVVQMDDGASPPTAQTNYATLKGQGLKMFRISGSGIATAMTNTLYNDDYAATTMASGPYLVTPRVGTIFSNYPIYTDQCAAIADWFFAAWNATHPGVKPRVAYLTNASFGQTVPTAEMTAYLTKIGYEVVSGCPAVPVVPALASDTAPMLSWCQDNDIDLTLGAMLVVGAVKTMTQAEAMGIGWNLDYEMTIGLGSPAHLTIFLRDAPAGVGNGLVIAGSYPPWNDTGDGVTFCKTLLNTYGGGFQDTKHIMYQHGVVEAMIQVEAIRLALINTGKTADKLTSADILNEGFLKITGLDTGGIIPTDITYGIGDVEGAESVRLDRNEGGVDVHLGDFPLRHVY